MPWNLRNTGHISKEGLFGDCSYIIYLGGEDKAGKSRPRTLIPPNSVSVPEPKAIPGPREKLPVTTKTLSTSLEKGKRSS